MNYKRGKPKSVRAGCLMCKPQKAQWFSKPLAKREVHGTGGFGKLRRERGAEHDLRAALAECVALQYADE